MVGIVMGCALIGLVGCGGTKVLRAEGSTEDSPVFLNQADDPEMKHAAEQARATFRFLWRELSWEQRRIVPGLALAAVKVAFSDPGGDSVEHMWINDISFDGLTIRGTLLNQPQQVRSVKEGDAVEITMSDVTDWMYATADGEVYGAYTVNLMRSRMGAAERRSHDEAWGLEFGKPDEIRLVPAVWEMKSPDDEHPMSENVAGAFREQIAADPSLLAPDDRGWTLLHHQALAGSAATVKVLLEAGADRNAKTPDGRTALDLARGLGWSAVVALLEGP